VAFFFALGGAISESHFQLNPLSKNGEPEFAAPLHTIIPIASYVNILPS